MQAKFKAEAFTNLRKVWPSLTMIFAGNAKDSQASGNRCKNLTLALHQHTLAPLLAASFRMGHYLAAHWPRLLYSK